MGPMKTEGVDYSPKCSRRRVMMLRNSVQIHDKSSPQKAGRKTKTRKKFALPGISQEVQSEQLPFQHPGARLKRERTTLTNSWQLGGRRGTAAGSSESGLDIVPAPQDLDCWP